MLTGLLLLVYAGCILLMGGAAVVRILERLTRQTVSLHPVWLMLSGTCWLVLWLQVYHLFFPIDGWAHVWMWLISIVPLWRSGMPLSIQWRAMVPEKKSGWLLLVLAGIAALLNGVTRAATGDIADYHLQAIQWMESFPVVPGIGNVRRQLGNNSSWFLLHAFSGLHVLGLRSVYMLNTLLLILAVGYFLPKQNDPYPVLKWIVLVYICAMAFRKYTGAVTNDYAITVFTLILFSEWITGNHRNGLFQFLFAWMCMVLITYKLSAIAMAIPVVWIGMLWLRYTRLLFLLVITGLLTFLPWIYTTFLHSGYMLYPVVQTGWFAPDWQMPEALLDFEIQINLANERVPGVPISEVLQMPFSEWFPRWIKSLDYFSLGLLLSYLLGWIGLVVFAISKRLQIQEILKNTRYLPVLVTIACALMIWFTQAPAIRFVFGYLVFFIAWVTDRLFPVFKQRNVHTLLLLPIILLIVGGAVAVKQYLIPKSSVAVWLKPEPYGNPKGTDFPLNYGTVFLPDSTSACWDAPIPCTGLLNNGLQRRGENIRDGFRLQNE